ncbi:hypothetical protein GCM10027563_47030 [Parasphingorhabdus pacifica]
MPVWPIEQQRGHRPGALQQQFVGQRGSSAHVHTGSRSPSRYPSTHRVDVSVCDSTAVVAAGPEARRNIAAWQSPARVPRGRLSEAAVLDAFGLLLWRPAGFPRVLPRHVTFIGGG